MAASTSRLVARMTAVVVSESIRATTVLPPVLTTAWSYTSPTAIGTASSVSGTESVAAYIVVVAGGSCPSFSPKRPKAPNATRRAAIRPITPSFLSFTAVPPVVLLWKDLAGFLSWLRLCPRARRSPMVSLTRGLSFCALAVPLPPPLP